MASKPLITVTELFQASRGLRANGYSVTAPSCAIVEYSGAHPCGLKMPTKREHYWQGENRLCVEANTKKPQAEH